MEKEIKELIEISQFYGKQKSYTIGGGGNTSYKNDKYLWVKASGHSLGTITEDGFAQLDRPMLSVIESKTYDEDSRIREEQILKDLLESRVQPEKKQRPSVETSFHNIIRYSYVVHTHPTLINALTCARSSKSIISDLFGDKALYIPYAPGYELFKMVQDAISVYRTTHTSDPQLIFLENHGIFVSANTSDEIKTLYDEVNKIIESKIKEPIPAEEIPIDHKIMEFLPALRMALSEKNLKVVRCRNNTLIQKYSQNRQTFHKISLPFIPDMIVYCKGKYLFIEDSSSPGAVLSSFKSQLQRFREEFGYSPIIVIIKNYGVFAFEENAANAEVALDVYEDLIKVSYLSENFGGPRFMQREEINFIENWEVENYRRKVSKGQQTKNPVRNKVAIVTGAAQGFGKGIAEELFALDANIVIADINDQKGISLADTLNARGNKNKAVYYNTDVGSPESVKNLIEYTVKEFGGLDVYISNAGILHAGDLDAMEPEVFERVTKINYSGFFYGAKYASKIMKLQSEYKNDQFFDIIQINSKSGLQGSNKNFAYAGGKFGGIGLTQSFAMELMPHRIKVNAICPGNFFEGPLWSDPVNGLFMQYLKTGKVPGARTIEDVKRYYENMIPAGRGCRVEDVIKAILYVIDQEYETGQAVPVTGGQIMLK